MAMNNNMEASIIKRKDNKKRFLPVKIIVAFNIFTLLLFVFSPWDYYRETLPSVITLVLFSQIMFYIGYRFIINKSDTLECGSAKKSTEVNLKLYYAWLAIGLCLSIPDFFYNTRIFSMSLSEVIGRIRIGFTNSFENYSNTLSYEQSGSFIESLFIALNSFLFFFKFSILPMTVLYWKKIGKTPKLICFFVETLEILKYIIKGMNKGLFDFVIILLACLIVTILSNNLKNRPGLSKERRNIGKVLILVACLGSVVIYMFVMNAISRSQSATISYYSTSARIYADENDYFLNILPDFLKRGYLSLNMYLTEGYNGLSYALNLPYEFNFGIGHNRFLISNAEEYLGSNVWYTTYMVRISEQYPWDSWVNWHSLYTWIANDIPFPFVPFVFFLLGMFFASAWRDAIKYRNPYAFIIVVLLFIELFYTSANNQLAALSYTIIAFYISLVMWIITKKKYRCFYKAG